MLILQKNLQLNQPLPDTRTKYGGASYAQATQNYLEANAR
jgi:hypothetical protein